MPLFDFWYVKFLKTKRILSKICYLLKDGGVKELDTFWKFSQKTSKQNNRSFFYDDGVYCIKFSNKTPLRIPSHSRCFPYYLILDEQLQVTFVPFEGHLLLNIETQLHLPSKKASFSNYIIRYIACNEKWTLGHEQECHLVVAWVFFWSARGR